jgi:mutual gliding-motility protein MglA
MVELNHRDRTIKIKVVYYGPPVGGKTTNLQILHQHASGARRGDMISINSAQDRTILFDLLPLKTPGFRGFDLRLQILAVPGQAMYAATRRLVLKGADSLVFVANSAVDRWEENIQSYREMTQNLLSHHLDPSTMPLVLQYNKRDLPQVMEPEIMDRALNARRVDAIPAVAVRGEGVLETFGAILMRTVLDLARRYAILDIKEGTPAEKWTEEALVGMFGTTSLVLGQHHVPQALPPPVIPRIYVPPSSEGGGRVAGVPAPGPPPASPATPATPVRPVAPVSPAAAPPPAPSGPPIHFPEVAPTVSPPAAGPVVVPAAATPAAATPPAPSPTPASPPPMATPPVPPPAAASAPPSTAPNPAPHRAPAPHPPAAAPSPPAAAAAANPRLAPHLAPPAPEPALLPETPATLAATGPIRAVIRVAPQPEETRGASAGPDARAGENLADSYAEASVQLGTQVGELREERDLARSRLDDLQKTLVAAQEILAGKPLDSSLQGVLARMATIAGVEHASFWLPQPGRPPRAAALLNLRDDPILPSRGAVRYVLENAARDTKPRLLFAADNAELGQAIERKDLVFQVVLAVPFRTPGGLQGMACLLYTADTARPVPDTLAHLGEISRALSAALELAATLEKIRGAERALELALAGTASLRGLEDVVSSLVELRDRLGAMRGRPDAPSWFIEEFARLAPSLQGALSSGRSLLAFSRGEIQRESVLVEELLGELRGTEVKVKVDPGAVSVNGDAALLRVGLRALVEHVRSTMNGPGMPVEIRAEPSDGRVLVSVGTGGAMPTGGKATSVASGMALNLAQRIAELHGGSLTAQTVPGVEDWLVLSLPSA